MIDFIEYQRKALSTDTYPEASKTYDHLLGLASEVGEICGIAKKIDRDRPGRRMTEEDRRHAILELGDVLWYVAAIAEDLGTNLPVVAEMNIRKLADRKARGALGGSGDDR